MNPHDEIDDAVYEAALGQGGLAVNSEFAAEGAWYDSNYSQLVVELRNGQQVVIPRYVLREISDRATNEELSEVQLMPTGTALRWPSLDADYEVSTLVARGRRTIYQMYWGEAQAWQPRVTGNSRSLVLR